MHMHASAYQRYGLLALRITVGWLFLYAGWTKIINSAWSAGGYLNGAQTFHGLYAWLASPGILPIVNFVNEWGLLLIGLSLLLGVGVRWAGIAGALMMVLYYFPVLHFPQVGEHGFIVDEHLIYAAALILLAGHHWEQPAWFKRLTARAH